MAGATGVKLNRVAERRNGASVFGFKTNPVIAGGLAGQIPRRGTDALSPSTYSPKFPSSLPLDGDGDSLIGTDLDDVDDRAGQRNGQARRKASSAAPPPPLLFLQRQPGTTLADGHRRITPIRLWQGFWHRQALGFSPVQPLAH